MSSDLDLSHTYIHRPDDYTINALNSFSFGNATPSKIKTKVDEPEGGDIEGEGISPTVAVDVTPRPSVVHTDAIPTSLSPPRTRLSTSPSPPSSSASASEAESDFHLALTETTSTSHTSRSSRASPGVRGREEVEFSSDDDSYEFDHLDYSEEDAEYGGEGEQIEISSARFSVGTGNGFNGFGPEYGPPGGFRDREGSVATVKMQIPPDAGGNERLPDFAPTAPAFTSPFPSTSSTDATAANTAPGSGGVDAEFDLDYITSFGPDLSSADPSSVPDFVRRPSAISISPSDRNHPSRKDSLGRSLFFWLPTLAGRRASTATVSSTNSSNANTMFMHDDSFAMGLLKWGGERYKEQRKDWSFRRDPNVVPLSSSRKAGEGSSKDGAGKEETSATRTRSASNAPRTSTPVGSTSAASSDTASAHTASEKDKDLSERDKQLKERDKDRAKDRVRRTTQHWRGMAIGSEEVWNNDLLGSFIVMREELGRKGAGPAQDSIKGPQQRLIIRFRPSSSSAHSALADSHLHLPHPPATVHKHSKAMAFSITRFYKLSSSALSSRGSRGAGRLSVSDSAPRGPTRTTSLRPASNKIILLAPRRVQEAFTSTTTTKMLADHGLLGDKDNETQEPKKEKERDRDRRRKSLGAEGTAPVERIRRKKSVVASQDPTVIPPVPPLPPSPSFLSPLDTNLPTTTKASPSPSPNTPKSPHTSQYVPVSLLASTEPPSSSASPSQRISSYTDNTDTDMSAGSTAPDSATLYESETSEATSASDTCNTSDASSHALPPRRRGPRRRHHERHGLDHDHNEDDTDASSIDDDSEYGYGYGGHFSRVIRTPHNETYGTVDVSVVDRQRALLFESSISSSSSSLSLFDRLTGKPRTRVIDSLDPSASALRATAGAFEPPWLILPSRGKQEQQRRVVDNLNTSFMDVGLLPSTPRDSHGRVRGGGARSSSSSATATPNGRRKSVSGAIGGKGKNGKKEKGRGNSDLDPSKDVFASVPAESLCMLLPLWPEDTDGPSQQHEAQSQYSFRRSPVPLERRTFLLVWYKANDPQIGKDGSKSGRDEAALAVIDSLIGLRPEKEREKKDKKKDKNTRSSGSSSKDSGKSSRTSPTSSNDSSGSFLRSSRSIGLGTSGSHRSGGSGTGTSTSSTTLSGTSSSLTWAQLHGNDERNILLPGFVITARKVSYRDLQGTGVRVPDEGISVNGSLEEAWRECNISDLGTASFLPDATILAVCHSRESGVEFDPEALVSLGLCRVLNPLPMGMVAEDFAQLGENGNGNEENQGGLGMGGIDLKLKLTPVGRAVMEMCWIGGLALNSFGPT